MRNCRFFLILFGVLVVFLVFRFFGPWEELMKQWRKSRPPTPFHFVSLKNFTDDQIAGFMSGSPVANSFHPADAPNSHFPEALWETDPKAAALAFADANRRPGNRERYTLAVDASSSVVPPDAGWLVFDPGSASCPLSSSGAFTRTVLRFGVEQPFLFHSATYDSVMSNSYVEGSSHLLQIIPLSPEEARFLAHTVFWLELIQSEDVRNRGSGAGDIKFTEYSSSNVSSTADSIGQLDWQIDKQSPRRIQERLWATSSIASRWSGEYDKETSLNFINILLTEILPKHLGKRWIPGPSLERNAWNLTLAERLKHREGSEEALEELGRIILSAFARHEADPWPAEALISLVESAGDSGLAATLPLLESLMASLPLASAEELELAALDAQFQFNYETPEDPEERKKWHRYQSLKSALEHDAPTHVRPPLARAIRQVRAMKQPAALIELAKGSNQAASWALQRLYRVQPNTYAEVLIARFPTEEKWGRRLIFTTLAELDPAAARRLLDSLSTEEIAELFLEITRFEIGHDPQRARSCIPTLLEIVEKPTKRDAKQKYPTASRRGPAIELLAKLPLDPDEKQLFERLLLKELKTPETDESIGKQAISQAAAAIVIRPDPDRFWDALYQATASETGSTEFDALLEALATLAVVKPEKHLTQFADLLRSRIRGHKGYIDKLCLAALALDLRALAPEILHFATSAPSVPDGDNPGTCMDTPCFHRYHSARHVIALWSEADTDILARMWTALLLNSSYDFVGTKTIPSGLRGRCHSAIMAATPEIRKQLIDRIRTNSELPRELSDWIGTLP